MSCGIYKIINVLNNHTYIGSSVNIEKRWNHHKCHLRNKSHHSEHLERAWCKYGEENFKFEIIEICDEKNLLIVEQKYIDALHPEYNVAKFAECSARGTTWSKERKENIYRKLKGTIIPQEIRDKISKTVTVKNFEKPKKNRKSLYHPISKYKGVSYCFAKRDDNLYVRKKPWIANIQFKKKRIHLGYFTTEEEAAKAYNEYKEKLI